MKLRILVLGFALSVLALALAWSESKTSRIGLTIPDIGQTGWGNKLNDNFSIIDSSVALNGSNTWTSYQVFNSSALFYGPQGADIALCDNNKQNCQHLSTTQVPSANGIRVSTMTFRQISFDNPQGSIFIGQGVGDVYSSTWIARPVTCVGKASCSNYVGSQVINGSAGGITALGYGAGAAERGIDNTYIGDFAGAYHRDGSYNIFLGENSGAGDGGNTSVAVSTSGIYIGQYTGGSSSAPLTNVVVIGDFAKVNRSNSVVLGVTNQTTGYIPFNVGIGTDTPRSTLTVVSHQNESSGAWPAYSLYVSTGGTSSTSNDFNLAVSTIGTTHFGGAARYKSKTKTGLQTIAVPGPEAGDAYFCSDCSTDAVCVSTGGINSFVRLSARTTACQ